MNLRIEKYPLAAFAALLVVTALAWTRLPARVPVHWGWSGGPDAWGAPYGALVVLPIAAALVYGVLLLVPGAEPGRTDMPPFRVRFAPARAVIGLLFAGLQAVMALSMGGAVTDPLAASAVVLGLWIALLGPVLSGIPRNAAVGIRTPATLASDAAWQAAHRAGARVFVITGLALALAGATRSRAAMLAAFAAFVIGGLYAGTRGAVPRSDGGAAPADDAATAQKR